MENNVIGEARKAAGLSRAGLARELGIPYRTLQNWEAGVSKPPAWAEKLILEKIEKMKEN